MVFTYFCLFVCFCFGINYFFTAESVITKLSLWLSYSHYLLWILCLVCLKCVKSNWPISVLRSDLEHRYSNNRCRLSSFFAHPTLALTAHHSRAIQCNHLSELSIESPFAGWIKWEPDVCWLPWTWSLCWLVLNSEPQMDLWTCNTRVNNNYN